MHGSAAVQSAGTKKPRLKKPSVVTEAKAYPYAKGATLGSKTPENGRRTRMKSHYKRYNKKRHYRYVPLGIICTRAILKRQLEVHLHHAPGENPAHA